MSEAMSRTIYILVADDRNYDIGDRTQIRAYTNQTTADSLADRLQAVLDDARWVVHGHRYVPEDQEDDVRLQLREIDAGAEWPNLDLDEVTYTVEQLELVDG